MNNNDSSQSNSSSSPSMSQSYRRPKPRRSVKEETFRSVLESVKMDLQKLNDYYRIMNRDQQLGTKCTRFVLTKFARLHRDITKLSGTKTRRINTAAMGLFKPVRISSQLATFTGFDPNGMYSRITITKFITNYIRENRLYNPCDKRVIIPDDALRTLLNYKTPSTALFGSPDVLTYFNLQRYLKHHFIRHQ